MGRELLKLLIAHREYFIVFSHLTPPLLSLSYLVGCISYKAGNRPP
jgi:hypothetical protein